MTTCSPRFSLTSQHYFSWLRCSAFRLVLSPPEIAGNVPPTEFSAARATYPSKAIAVKPHAIGSPAHAEVRDYIVRQLVKIGLQPQVQKATAVNTFWGRPYRAAVNLAVAKFESG